MQRRRKQTQTPPTPSLSTLLPLLLILSTVQSYAPNFITKIISSSQTPPYDDDEKDRVGDATITTRFPPEPNGYLHLGHAKAISFNFAVARLFGGRCHLRMDDTNPSKEDEEYVNSIKDDVRWIQSDLPPLEETTATSSNSNPWCGPVRKTSDYFDDIYDFALDLIDSGDAYVDSLSAEEMREYRGTLTDVGKDSPYRERSVEENRKMFEDMKNGKYPDGAHVLRAKIDMSSPNLNLRDPVLYRIKHESHQETGDKWCIYPMYDFSHPIADSLEGITHSLCTLEFEDHRPLYDWCVQKLWERWGGGEGKITVKPRQIEFSRLNLKNTVLSKRKLITLVTTNAVTSWSDPRMPTISAIRRRGFPPAALRLFCERVGISKSDSNIDYTDLENAAREVLDDSVPRAFCLLEPLKVTITNWEGGSSMEDFEVDRHPKYEEMGQRTLPFGRELYIESSDFWDVKTQGPPPKGFKRLVSDNGSVRLRYAYVIDCTEVIRDDNGKPTELKCTYRPETRAGVTPPGMKRVNGIIQWVERSTAARCRVNEYDRLFSTEEPGKESDDFLLDINKDSLKVYEGAVCEPSVAFDALGAMAELRQQQEKKIQEEGGIGGGEVLYPSDLRYQFERCGYFALDEDASPQKLVFNRIVTLRDTWGTTTPASETTTKRNRGNDNNNNQQSRGKNKQQSSQQEPVEDARRIALRAGTIQSAIPHPDADSLLVCTVSFGDDDEAEPRTVVAGLATIYSPQELINKRIVAITNLKPAKMRGVESTAMLLAAESGGDVCRVELLSVPEDVKDGELLKFEGMDDPQPDEMLKSKGAQKVWERVRNALKTSGDDGIVGYEKDGETFRLVSSKGGVVVKSGLMGAIIR